MAPVVNVSKGCEKKNVFIVYKQYCLHENKQLQTQHSFIKKQISLLNICKTKEHSCDVLEKDVELHKMQSGYKKIAKTFKKKMPISTIMAIIKKFQSTVSVMNQPGRRRVSILSQHTVRRMV